MNRRWSCARLVVFVADCQLHAGGAGEGEEELQSVMTHSGNVRGAKSLLDLATPPIVPRYLNN
jgi:hypothetical protein